MSLRSCSVLLGLFSLTAFWAACSSDSSPVPAGLGGASGAGAAGAAGASGQGGGSAGGGHAGSAGSGHGGQAGSGGGPVQPPAASCQAASSGGASSVQRPTVLATIYQPWHEAWLGSPAIVDLDGDGTKEILAPRDTHLMGWHSDGQLVFDAPCESGRIWASAVVADLRPDEPGLEVAAGCRGKVYAWNAKAEPLSGFPVDWRDEVRSLAAGDIDGDGALELVAVTTSRLEQGGQEDILFAVHADGSPVAGFPPNTSGASGCDDHCYIAGGYDQNIALGDVDGDGISELFAPHDNAYMSLHKGTGFAFDSNPIFRHPKKFPGIRFLLDYALAQQGYADDEENSNQAHFTNSAPAIADIDGDGTHELVVLSSVQNAAQTDRFRGVALWVLHSDGTRPEKWTEPFHVPEYLAGLWDFEGTNVVGATNQVTVADLDPSKKGPEFVFAGFDGKIHGVDAAREALWSYTYTTDERVLTGGVLVADLSGDGRPEIIFNSYSPDDDKSHLFILDAGGNELYKIALPGRGAMPVPSVGDVDGDGTVEIVVSLKDSEENTPQLLIYSVPGSSDNCLLWPTGRGNLLRNGYVP